MAKGFCYPAIVLSFSSLPIDFFERKPNQAVHSEGKGCQPQNPGVLANEKLQRVNTETTRKSASFWMFYDSNKRPIFFNLSTAPMYSVTDQKRRMSQGCFLVCQTRIISLTAFAEVPNPDFNGHPWRVSLNIRITRKKARKEGAIVYEDNKFIWPSERWIKEKIAWGHVTKNIEKDRWASSGFRRQSANWRILLRQH